MLNIRTLHRSAVSQLEVLVVVLAPLTAKELDVLKSDLADDAAKAEAAIWRLVFAPEQSLPHFK
jgi:hypothetical protein